MAKVLVFGITENPGGVESVIMNYYRNINKEKIEFDFLCNSNEVAYEDEIKNLGGTIYKITARSKNRKQFKKDLNNVFKKKYDAIWVNVCSLANIDYLKYAKKNDVKYRIIHSHNSQNMDSKLRMVLHKINKLFISRYATDFWSCSEEASKWFYNKKIMNSDKYKIINNAIDVDKYRYDENIRKTYRNNMHLNEKFIIGNIGRFHFQKNHIFVLQVFKEVLKKDKNAYLILVGQGEEEEKIKNKISEYGIQENVLLLGVRNDISNILQMMDVFLFPSLFEGLPLALIEAQTNGLPIYASSSIPPKAKMVENFYFLDLNNSPEEWADEIIKTAKNARNNENYKIIEQKGYSIKKEAKMIERYFERI